MHDGWNAGDYIAEKYARIVSADDRRLLSLATPKHLSQDTLDAFLADWDIEKYGGRQALFLSYIMKQNPELIFPPYFGPRLNGLIRYYRFHNLNLLRHFCRVVKALNERGITPMVLKGMAVKSLRPELPRIMGDTDILVSNDIEWRQALDTAKDLGYEVGQYEHSVDLHMPGSDAGTVDIHRSVGALNYRTDQRSVIAAMFAHGKPDSVSGAQVIVPSREDIMFLLLVNLAHNIAAGTNGDGMIFTVHDIRFLTKNNQDFAWPTVLKRADQSGTRIPLYLGAAFIDKLVPGCLPSKLLTPPADERTLTDYCIMSEFTGSHYNPIKEQRVFLKQCLGSISSMRSYISWRVRYQRIKRAKRSVQRMREYLQAVSMPL